MAYLFGLFSPSNQSLSLLPSLLVFLLLCCFLRRFVASAEWAARGTSEALKCWPTSFSFCAPYGHCRRNSMSATQCHSHSWLDQMSLVKPPQRCLSCTWPHCGQSSFRKGWSIRRMAYLPLAIMANTTPLIPHADTASTSTWGPPKPGSLCYSRVPRIFVNNLYQLQ